MPAMSAIKDLFILFTVASLLVVGVGITLRSGLVAAGRERTSQILGNLSRMVVALASWTAVISFVQQWAGLRFSFLP